MKPIVLRIAELILIFWILLTIIIIAFDLIDLSEVNVQDDPFDTYKRNPGIVRINIISLLSRSVFWSSLVFLSYKPQYKGKFLLCIFLLSGLTSAFLQWYELYYGSTFYYGEVRDKQGLAFPLLGLFIVTLMIWECSFSSNEDWDQWMKMVLTALVNLGLYVLWLNVAEPWNLIQS